MPTIDKDIERYDINGNPVLTVCLPKEHLTIVHFLFE